MPRVVLSAVLCSVVACSLLQGAFGSQAWSQFEASAEQASSSRRLMAAGLDQGSYAATVQVQPLQSQEKVPTNVDSAFQRFVTVNKFIAQGTNGDGFKIQARILSLCKAGAPGSEISFINNSGFSSTIVAEPMCYYCLTRGYGVDEHTPGFYLPCGCQRTCVDVSGYTKGSFKSVSSDTPNFYGPSNGGGFPYLSNSVAQSGVYGGAAQTLGTCQDFIDNKIVTTCNQMFIYHFVLWPSVLAIASLAYASSSIANMQLDMDSLLYTVGSSGKKDA